MARLAISKLKPDYIRARLEPFDSIVLPDTWDFTTMVACPACGKGTFLTRTWPPAGGPGQLNYNTCPHCKVTAFRPPFADVLRMGPLTRAEYDLLRDTRVAATYRVGGGGSAKGHYGTAHAVAIGHWHVSGTQDYWVILGLNPLAPNASNWDLAYTMVAAGFLPPLTVTALPPMRTWTEGLTDRQRRRLDRWQRVTLGAARRTVRLVAQAVAGLNQHLSRQGRTLERDRTIIRIPEPTAEELT